MGGRNLSSYGIAAAIAAGLIALSSCATPGFYYPRITVTAQVFGECHTLEACLDRFDNLQPNGRYSEPEVIVRQFIPFGDAAKRALLRRDLTYKYWGESWAATLLRKWPDWSASDIPDLHIALRRGHGWAASQLAALGTPEAIDILYENRQWDVLASFGHPVLPSLTPVLAEQGLNGAAWRLVYEMKDKAVAQAEPWARQAANINEDLNLRLGALVGLDAIGWRARDVGPIIRPLLNDRRRVVRTMARQTLMAIRDPSVLAYAAATCEASAGRLSSFSSAEYCILELADYEGAGEDVGPTLLRLVDGPDGGEAASAITALGYLGYQPAAPRLRADLNSTDWRRAFAAAQSLGWLGDREALGALDAAAASHWYPAVRLQALQSATAIRASGKLTRPGRLPDTYGYERDVEPLARCTSGRWSWKGQTFEFDGLGWDRLRTADGLFTIQNTDFESRSLFLNGRMVVDDPSADFIQPAPGGVLAVSAYRSDTRILYVRRNIRGRVIVSEVVYLPRPSRSFAVLAEDRFAVLMEGFPVVFTIDGIEGLATCITVPS